MEKKFKSMSEIAKYIGIHKTTFSKYYKGKNKILKSQHRKALFDLTEIESFRFPKPSENELEMLRKWIDSAISTNKFYGENKFMKDKFVLPSKLFKTKIEIAMELGMPTQTLNSYYYQDKKVKRLKYRKKIFELTGIESFKLPNPAGAEVELLRKWIDSALGGKKNRKTVTPIPRKDHTGINPSYIMKESITDEIAETFYALIDILEKLKQSTPEMRALIKKRIPARDIGYATSFLRALYDEDQFSDFIFFSEYKRGA